MEMDFDPRQRGLPALLLILATVTSIAAQPRPKTPQTTPTIETGPVGQHTLHLTEPMQKAVAAFLRANPAFSAANCETLHLGDTQCSEAYKNWQDVARFAKAQPQFPYALWADLNGDGMLDFVIPFFSRTAANNFGWRTWKLVVFLGSRDGIFRPVVAMRDVWGACFDGMIFNPSRKQVEYWCGSGGGSFRWIGSAFVGKPLRGD